jgi:hypothetical protein
MGTSTFSCAAHLAYALLFYSNGFNIATFLFVKQVV